MKKALFQLGTVVMTPGAQNLMKELGLDPVHWLARHVTGDWGDLDEQDKQANDCAVLLKGLLVGRLHNGTGDAAPTRVAKNPR
jgi:hypothetical protein